MGTRSLCLLSPRSIVGIAATTSRCAGGRCAAASVVVDGRRGGDRGGIVADWRPDLDAQDRGRSLCRHTACHRRAVCRWREHRTGRTAAELYHRVTCYYSDFLALLGAIGGFLSSQSEP